MFGDFLAPTHLVFILIVALVVLGPKRLPEAGRALGRGLRDFKDAVSPDNLGTRDLFETDDTHRDSGDADREKPSPSEPAVASTAEAPPSTDASNKPASDPPPAEPVDATVVEEPTAVHSASGSGPSSSEPTPDA